MRKCTVLSWANGIDITESEFNGYLEKLGYLFRNNKTMKWERTFKAMPLSKVLFKKTYWDIDVVYDVLKIKGKTEGTYFYCDTCGAYNKIEDSMQNVWFQNYVFI